MIKDVKDKLALRVCDDCGHEQWTDHSNLKRKLEHFCRYCSVRRSGIAKRGRPSHNKGKIQQAKHVGSHYVNSSGYIETWVGKHTLPKMSGGYYREHRLQAEVDIGRNLMDNEKVHHIDGDKTHNWSSNLFVCRDDAHHRNVHNQLERLSMDLVKQGAIKFNYSLGIYELDPQLGNWLSKSGELLETPEKDNQQRSLRDLSPEERSTTIQKWSTLKRGEAPDTQNG